MSSRENLSFTCFSIVILKDNIKFLLNVAIEESFLCRLVDHSMHVLLM